jgi:putative transposase
MPKKRFSAEQIVVVLRQIEVLMSQGKGAPVACPCRKPNRADN